ncbi:MAG: GNAT family N-acetyltransferase [candidate division Zixibacteria bacterium]
MNNFRVKLTEFTEDDLINYHKWFLESEPLRITCRPLGDISIEAVLKIYAGRFAGENIRHFAVRRIEDDKLIGRVTYFDLNTRNRAAEIGFLMGPEYRGKGYAYEAITLLL